MRLLAWTSLVVVLVAHIIIPTVNGDSIGKCSFLALVLLLLFSSSLGSQCTVGDKGDADCHDQLGAVQVCKEEEGIAHCVHKELLPPSIFDIFLSILLVLGGAVASGGGVGGGGIYVPLLVLVGRFELKPAVALSNAVIFGAAVANFVQLVRRRHPRADRPLIDYPLSFFLMPLALGGTAIGVLLNAVLPPFLLLIILVAVLVFTTYKATTLHREEKAAKAKAAVPRTRAAWNTSDSPESGAAQIEMSAVPEETAADSLLAPESVTDVPLPTAGDNGHSYSHTHANSSLRGSAPPSPAMVSVPLTDDDTGSRRQSAEATTTLASLGVSGQEESTHAQLAALLAKERRTPWPMMALQLVYILLLAFLTLARGSAKNPSLLHVEQCSPTYWVLMFLPLPVLLGLTFVWARVLMRTQATKTRVNYTDHPGDIRWTPRLTAVVAFVGFLAGILASCIGIGGGMVLSPLMLELRVLPDVTAATSSFMILFTSIMSVLQYSVLGTITFDYGLWLGFIGLVSSFLGLTVLTYLVKKYNKKSYIVFSIAIVIAASTVLLVSTGLMNLVASVKAGEDWSSFRPACR